MQKGTVSLVSTGLLCLPSLAVAGAVIVNDVFQRQMSEWGIAVSVLVAITVFFGGPLVILAALVSTLAGLSRRVELKIKYANYVIVVLAMIATFSLTFHFGM